MFFLTISVFFVLLLRDPFSQRTLIPNFEPFPDAIHYVNPALSFLKGEGLRITRESRGFYPSVPPLYSLMLLPLYAVNNDPRMFYFTNVILSLLSFWLFFLVLKKLFKNIWIIGFALFIFATSFYLYWYPTLAMAENLTLLLFIAALYLLLLKPDFKKSLISGFITTAFIATKYANLPLAAVLFLLYCLHIFKEIPNKKVRFKLLTSFFLFSFCSFILFFAYEYLIKKNEFITVIPTNDSAAKTAWFSLAYIQTNIPHYLDALIGNPIRFLWQSIPLLQKIIAIPAVIGLFIALLRKPSRFAGFSLLVILAISILFLSFFYTVDMRYINFAIPILILGFGFFLDIFSNKPLFFYIIFSVFSLFYLVTNFQRLKFQASLNLKYAETPWYYISVLKLNEYFKIVPKGEKKPIVISALAPYFVDFYSNGNYGLLPLHNDQEFRHSKEFAWGPNDYSNLLRLYRKYLDKGYPVYIHNYGLGNEDYLKDAFKEVETNFRLQKVAEGCYDLCNIYKLSPNLGS